MKILQNLAILAEGSFGSGFGVGFGSGFAAGIGAGMAAGSGSGTGNATTKLKRQLASAIEAGEISVVNKDGATMTVDSFFQVLQEKYPTA